MKKIPVIAFALLLLLSLAGCSAEKEASAGVTPAGSYMLTPEKPAAQSGAAAGITVTDLVGREMQLVPGSYRRVVCIGAGALRMYCYVGDTALLCGVEDIDNLSLSERPKMFDTTARPYMLVFGEEFTALPSCGVGGPNAQSPEAEKILACGADIIISEYEDADRADALAGQCGIPVLTLRSGPMGVFDESFAASLRLLGAAFDRGERVEELLSFIDGERAEIAGRTADVPEAEKPAVYICGLGSWGTTNHLYTSPDYVSFAVANVRNAVTDLAAPGVQAIEAEKFTDVGADADIMIMDAAAVKNIQPLLAEDPSLFDGFRAWENGEVYLQMAFNAYYTNYELALINTWFIAKTVYPDRFADIDLTVKADEVTEAFLGKPVAAEIFACPASFGGYQKIDTASFFG